MRLFIGLTLPEATRRSIRDATRSLRSIRGIRWVPVENLHLTLVFLGELDQDFGGAAQAAVALVAPRHSTQALELGSVGAFPNVRRPSVVWLGADGGEELAALREDLADEVRQHGMTVERRLFRPHITLGRVRRTHRFRRQTTGTPGTATIDANQLMELAETVDYAQRVVISSVDLIESELASDGARYTTVLQSRLHGADRSAESS